MEKGELFKKKCQQQLSINFIYGPKVIFVPILQEEAVYEEPTPKFEPPPPPQPMLVPVSN